MATATLPAPSARSKGRSPRFTGTITLDSAQFGVLQTIAAACALPSHHKALLDANKMLSLFNESIFERRLNDSGLSDDASSVLASRKRGILEWIDALTQRKDESNEVRLQDGERPERIANLNAEWDTLTERLRAICEYGFSTSRNVKPEAKRIILKLMDGARCARPL